MIDLINTPLVFVDCETTGFSPNSCRMIEVAAIRVEYGQVTQKVHSLLHLDDEVPEKITEITGITNDMLVDAPTFKEVLPQLMRCLENAIFVAHFAEFDYSFFVSEYQQVDPYLLPDAPTLCTKKLSKAFYPDMPSHKLETLIEQHGFTYSERHRAYDDAAVLVQLMDKIKAEFGSERLTTEVDRLYSPAPSPAV
jgi:DNA polymerase-3 subunit epsilon